MEPSSSITIGGIEYRIASGDTETIEFDIYAQSLIKKNALPELATRPGESPTEYVMRVNESLILSGTFFSILATFLVPAGKEWTKDGVAEVEKALRALRSPEDKETVRGLAVEFLTGFFRGGLFSSMSSQSFLDELAGQQPSPEDLPNHVSPSIGATGTT